MTVNFLLNGQQVTADTTPDNFCWIHGSGGVFPAPTIVDTLVGGAITLLLVGTVGVILKRRVRQP